MATTVNEEIDDGEFYHHDFTTASEWEFFIARMEEILHEWKIQETRNQHLISPDKEWSIKTELINFADVQFTLSEYKHRKVEERKMSTDDNSEKEEYYVFNPAFDFIPYNSKNTLSDFPLYYWYGLHHFITLSTSHNTPIDNESQIKVLLSSINIVISNSGCDVPIFVQIREKWQNYYLGTYETTGVRTNFEMIHLRKGPQHCKYLTGLLDLFKTKIASSLPLQPVRISYQLSFTLNNWMSNTWPSDLDLENLELSDIVKLEFGVKREPISDLILNATWLQFPEHSFIDSENYSDFDPLQASIWSVKVSMTEYPVCLLSKNISEFTQLGNNNCSLEDLLGDLIITNNVVYNPLDILTESPVPTISTVVKRATGERKVTKIRVPVENNMLTIIHYFLFPDAETDGEEDTLKEAQYAYQLNAELDSTCQGLKTCNPDTLVWRLAIILSQAMVSLGGPKTVAYLWYKFVQQMRYRWENSILIPGMNPGFPDTRTCILHQKLQMLNCCIDRKKARELKEILLAKSDYEDRSSDEYSEDEFFDCDVEKLDDDNYSKHSLWNKPVGRMIKYGTLKLIRTGEQMYIPITQDPVPKTEDQLEEDTDILLKLETDEPGSDLRARMMGALLLSDMESFKAANPDAVIEDFIRWFSPADWVEENDLDEWGQKRGHLSKRMLISDNYWIQMWESAKPVPANRQKRLFDDTREAEKVLHYLESQSLSHICKLILPVLTHVAISYLNQEIKEINYILPKDLLSVDDLLKNLRHISREPHIDFDKYEALFSEIATQELLICRMKSLIFKFNRSQVTNEDLNKFILNLALEKEITVDGGSKSNIGCKLKHMFSEFQQTVNMTGESLQGLNSNQQAQKSASIFPQPSKREFVMRLSTERSDLQSSSLNHMLRATFSKNDFRLIGAFSEDIFN